MPLNGLRIPLNGLPGDLKPLRQFAVHAFEYPCWRDRRCPQGLRPAGVIFRAYMTPPPAAAVPPATSANMPGPRA